MFRYSNINLNKVCSFSCDIEILYLERNHNGFTVSSMGGGKPKILLFSFFENCKNESVVFWICIVNTVPLYRFLKRLKMYHRDENALEKFITACEESNKELVEELVASDESIIDATSGNIVSFLK